IKFATEKTLDFLNCEQLPFEITGCWANINSTGASHAIHSHPNNFLSGVYYVQTQVGADTVNFHDPRSQTGIIRPPVTELTAQNTDQVVVNVNQGTLLMFPAYLQHSVSPNESDTFRISISFNLMFSLFAENLSEPLWKP
ncbi:MAG: 2OG-Fe(II) oxygenase family protein, partial [Proteobacteria bacterium]|nr:2OG-Fe(II) oxygenase family protein [Pseudomonadota bacterium]